MNAKLKAISALSASFLDIQAEQLNAQSFYKDYVPDTAFTYDTSYMSGVYEIDLGDIPIDMNEDGGNDFSFR